MADQNWPAYGQQHPMGMAPDRNLPVVVSSPHHHFALTQAPAARDRLDESLAAVLGSDAGGLRLSIVRVQRPPGSARS